MKICFATHNPNKLREIQLKLGEGFQVVSLDDIGFSDELPEHQKTLEGNSLEKAEFIFKNYRIDCFADDTGLEVFALDGEPGVLSARYAGPQKNARDNIELLLKNLEEKDDRGAQFRTVITLIYRGKTKQFEGLIKGKIIKELKGTEGFGYDPVFIPKGYDKTFAEMSMEEKNIISHRAKAVEKLVNFLLKHT